MLMSHLPLISEEFELVQHAAEKGTDYLLIPFLVWIMCQPWAKCQQNVQEPWHICLWLVTLVSRTQCPSRSLSESPVSCFLFLDPFLPTVCGGGFGVCLQPLKMLFAFSFHFLNFFFLFFFFPKSSFFLTNCEDCTRLSLRYFKRTQHFLNRRFSNSFLLSVHGHMIRCIYILSDQLGCLLVLLLRFWELIFFNGIIGLVLWFLLNDHWRAVRLCTEKSLFPFCPGLLVH